MTAGSETAYAKLNLALHVRAREADGYHVIETLFAFCADGDRLEWMADGGLEITGPFAQGLVADGDNLVLRAAHGFAELCGIADVGGFRLDKRLPVAAGIGGGSADAAAVLRLLARRHGVDASSPDLLALAATLGADVPACLASRPARGHGRGDRLEALPNHLAGTPVLLVNPMLPLATGPVFRGWDGIDRGPLAGGDMLAAARASRNDLEPAAMALLPSIRDVATLLAKQPGVTLSRMSGSGATCFALFEAFQARDAADHAIADVRPEWWRLATSLR